MLTKFLTPPWLALILLLTLALGLRIAYIWGTPWNTDEGHWLMFGRLANAEHPAYSETFVGIPPTALLAIQLGAKLFGSSLAARVPIMLLSLLSLVGLFWSLMTLDSTQTPAPPWLTALIAATLLSFNFDYFQFSAQIMTEVAAISLALMALAFAQQYTLTPRPHWLYLSGIATMLSLTLKVFVIFIPLLIMGEVVRMEHERGMRKNKDTKDAKQIRSFALTFALFAFALGCLTPLILFIVMYNPIAMAQQVLAFRFALRATLAPTHTWQENLSLMASMGWDNRPLIIGALVGLMLGWRAYRPQIILWLAWFSLTFIIFLTHIPLRQRYGVLFIPPLAALTAIAVSEIYARIKPHRFQKPVRFGFITIVLVLATIPTLQQVSTGLVTVNSGDNEPARLAAINYLEMNTLPQDCLITDDQRVTNAANRLSPPWLSEASHARFVTGWLTMTDILTTIQTADCPMVAFADPKELFTTYFPELPQRLADLYAIEIPFSRKTTLFVGLKQHHHPPQHPLTAQFSNQINFLGFDLNPTRPQIALYFAALRPLEQDYKISLQLRSMTGNTVLTADHYPFPAPPPISLLIQGEQRRVDPQPTSPYQRHLAQNSGYPHSGMFPTRAWPVGQTIREVTTLTPPPDLPVGDYQLYLNIYDPATMARLPLSADSNEIYLTTFTLGEQP